MIEVGMVIRGMNGTLLKVKVIRGDQVTLANCAKVDSYQLTTDKRTIVEGIENESIQVVRSKL